MNNGSRTQKPIATMARPTKRAAIVRALKKNVAVAAARATAVIALYEFDLQSTTHTHYTWVEKNPAPVLPSNDRQRQKLKGFLVVDLSNCQPSVDFQSQAKTENGVLVNALIVLRYAIMGIHLILFILDNCSIHNATMKDALMELLAEIALAQGKASTPRCTRPTSIRPNT